MSEDEDYSFEFGRPEERNQFAKDHRKFLECIPNLREAAKISFIRKFPKLTNEDYIILALGKLCLDNFMEIMLLCSNRFGDGAFIIIRSMFEKLVNARYLHMHPEKADSFMKFFFVHMRTVKNQIASTYGEDKISENYENMVETNFDQVRDEFTFTIGGGKERTKSSWSDMSFVDMTIHVGLKEFIVPAYYMPIERAHPSVPSVITQSKDIGEGKRVLFEENPELERGISSDSLVIGHKLLIEMFMLQHEHFQDDNLKKLIGQCLQDYTNTWKGYKQSALDNHAGGV